MARKASGELARAGEDLAPEEAAVLRLHQQRLQQESGSRGRSSKRQ